MEKEEMKCPVKVWLRMDDEWQWVEVATIVYGESCENYTKLFRNDGNEHVTSGWLWKTFCTIDNYNFYIINKKKYFVNLDYVQKYDNSENERWVYMAFEKPLQASVREAYWFADRLEIYKKDSAGK